MSKGLPLTAGEPGLLRLVLGQGHALDRTGNRTSRQTIKQVIILTIGPLFPLVDLPAPALRADAKLGREMIRKHTVIVGLAPERERAPVAQTAPESTGGSHLQPGDDRIPYSDQPTFAEAEAHEREGLIDAITARAATLKLSKKDRVDYAAKYLGGASLESADLACVRDLLGALNHAR